MAKLPPTLCRLLMALTRRLLRFGVFVLCWAGCATLYYQFAKPDLDLPPISVILAFVLIK